MERDELEAYLTDEEEWELDEEELEAQRLLEDYRAYWLREFGDDPSLPERVRLQLEAQRRRAGGVAAIQQRRRQELAEKLPSDYRQQRAVSRLQSRVRERSAIPCEGRDASLNPAQVIRLRMVGSDGKIRYVCYDVVALMNYLTSISIDPFGWRDPITKGFYTRQQVDLIRSRYNALNKCDIKAVHRFKARLADDGLITIPKALYDDLAHRPNVGYFSFRVEAPQTLNYDYIVATGFNHSKDVLYLPAVTLDNLQIKPEAIVTLRECFDIPPISDLTVRPKTAGWFGLKESDTDAILVELTRVVEQLPLLRLGDELTFTYQGNDYILAVKDLSFKGKRIDVGVPKNIEVNLHIDSV